MKTVLFIASIGVNNSSKPNGVNVKNRHILKYLNDMRGIHVRLIDTENWKKNILSLLYKIGTQTFKSDKIILSINTNSAYQIIKFLKILNLDSKLIYFVVGGSLPQQLMKRNLNINKYTNILKIFVETKKMREELVSLGLNNVETLANSKYFNEISIDYMREIGKTIKCFYLGRIHPEKGIEILFEALNNVNRLENKYEIDFFGPIEEEYNSKFANRIESSEYAKFNGIIDLVDNPSNYYKLSTYDLFIFPTYWHGEGFPGVVLDSFISGVPVLASDWNHNSEIIDNGRTGFIFKAHDAKALEEKLEEVYNKKETLIEMRKNCHEESRCYKSENVLRTLEGLIYLS